MAQDFLPFYSCFLSNFAKFYQRNVSYLVMPNFQIAFADPDPSILPRIHFSEAERSRGAVDLTENFTASYSSVNNSIIHPSVNNSLLNQVSSIIEAIVPSLVTNDPYEDTTHIQSVSPTTVGPFNTDTTQPGVYFPPISQVWCFT
jgi:hypothetical protein